MANQWKLESNQPIRIESDKPIRVRNVEISKRSANQSTKNLVNWHLKDHQAKFKAIKQFRTNIELQTYQNSLQITKQNSKQYKPFTSQGRIQKIQKGVAGTLNSSILDTFYFSETEFYKNNTKSQRERGGHSPLGPPQNPPSSQPSTSTKLTIRF